MKKLLVFAIITVGSVVYGAKEIDLSKLQNRNGIYYEINQDKGYTGKVISKYSNGQLKVEENFKNGKFYGVQKAYFENGQLKSEKNFKNGKENGTLKTWYANGQLESEGNFKDGKESGSLKTWYEDGQLKSEGNYKDGNFNGVLKTWYENGQLKSEGSYKDGNFNGVLKTWYKNGELESEGTYKDGKLVGSSKSWYENGKIWIEENHENVKSYGIRKEYYENGQLKSKIISKDGKRIDLHQMLIHDWSSDEKPIFYNDLIVDMFLKNKNDMQIAKEQFETDKEYNSRIKKEFELRKKSVKDRLNSYLVLEFEGNKMIYNKNLERWELYPNQESFKRMLSSSIGNNSSYELDKYKGNFLFNGYEHASYLEYMLGDNEIVFYEPIEKAKKRENFEVFTKLIVSSEGIKKPLSTDAQVKNALNVKYTEYKYILKTNVLGYQLRDSKTGQVLTTVIFD